jgi:hypothetical protein
MSNSSGQHLRESSFLSIWAIAFYLVKRVFDGNGERALNRPTFAGLAQPDIKLLEVRPVDFLAPLVVSQAAR